MPFTKTIKTAIGRSWDTTLWLELESDGETAEGAEEFAVSMTETSIWRFQLLQLVLNVFEDEVRINLCRRRSLGLVGWLFLSVNTQSPVYF